MGQGSEPEEQAACHGNRECDQRHAQVDGHLADPRERVWKGAYQSLDARAGDHHADRAASDGKDHALGHGLANQPAAAGAERRQHGELTPACLGPREHQIRHVDTRDEQHKAYGCLQHPDRLSGAAENLVGEGGHAKGVAVRPLCQRLEHVAGVTRARRDASSRGPALSERGELGLGHRRRDIVPQPPDQREAMVQAGEALSVCEP